LKILSKNIERYENSIVFSITQIIRVMYNLIAYSIYLPITAYITLVIGKDLNQKGEILLLHSFGHKVDLVQTLNRFLLIGYYLLNLGYAAISLNLFEQLYSLQEVFEALVLRIGVILISLGLVHYMNLFVFTKYAQKIQQLFSNHSH
jgi:hypothetical protein